MRASEFALTFASVALIGCGQILFKVAARTADFSGLRWAVVASWLSAPMVAALLLSTVATVLWIAVLRTASLGLAYPLYALGFVLVPVLDATLFGSAFTLRHGLGAATIVGGVWLMSAASA